MWLWNREYDHCLFSTSWQYNQMKAILRKQNLHPDILGDNSWQFARIITSYILFKIWHSHCLYGDVVKLILYLKAAVLPIAVFFATNGAEPSSTGSLLKEISKAVIGADDLRDLKTILDQTSRQIKRGRNQPCFCDSGLKYKKCHLSKIKSLYSFYHREELIDFLQ